MMTELSDDSHSLQNLNQVPFVLYDFLQYRCFFEQSRRGVPNCDIGHLVKGVPDDRERTFQRALFFVRQVIRSQRPLLFMLATHVTVNLML
jgi:hypothetical protein